MRVLRLALAVGLIIAVAGCGDDGDDDEVAGAPSVASAAAAPAAGGDDKVLTALVGEQGKPDAFAVSLADASGAAVTTLPAGEYQIKVSDPSKIHNLHLTGAGVDEKTNVKETAEVTWTVQLTAGTYIAVCDPHPKKMKLELIVT